jgi:hypothetical protein
VVSTTYATGGPNPLVEFDVEDRLVQTTLENAQVTVQLSYQQDWLEAAKVHGLLISRMG